MTQPRLTAEFQPCTTDGAVGMEAITHSGPSITMDPTAYVIGLTPDGIRDIRKEVSRFGNADLDHVAELIPNLVEDNAGPGGYDVLLNDYDMDDLFRGHGLEISSLGDDDLARLREEYGVAAGAVPALADDVPSALSPQ